MALLRNLWICFFVFSTTTLASETDQFTRSEKSLSDLGNDISLKVAREIMDAKNKINKKKPEKRTIDNVREEFRKRNAVGVPKCQLEAWIMSGKHRDAQFFPGLQKTVFEGATAPFPGAYLELGHTLNMFGHDVGVDKIGHFFQQGYEYYERYQKALSKGLTEMAAIEAAIQGGIKQEKGIFGYATTGVYSNADLAANYSGFLFYLRFDRNITIDGRILPKILHMKEGEWEINPDAGKPDELLKYHFSDHMNEALNPSVLHAWIRRTLIEAVQKRCDQWPHVRGYSTREAIENERMKLQTFFGASYGHWERPEAMALLSQECFK